MPHKTIKYILASRQNELMNEKRIVNQKYFDREESEKLVGIYSYGRMLASLTQQQPRPPPMPPMGGFFHIKSWSKKVHEKTFFLELFQIKYTFLRYFLWNIFNIFVELFTRWPGLGNFLNELFSIHPFFGSNLFFSTWTFLKWTFFISTFFQEPFLFQLFFDVNFFLKWFFFDEPFFISTFLRLEFFEMTFFRWTFFISTFLWHELFLNELFSIHLFFGSNLFFDMNFFEMNFFYFNFSLTWTFFWNELFSMNLFYFNFSSTWTFSEMNFFRWTFFISTFLRHELFLKWTFFWPKNNLGQPPMARPGMNQMAAGPPPQQAQMMPQGGIKAESSMDVRRQIPNTHPYKRP